MMCDERLLNIIEGTDYNDIEDIRLRHAIVTALRERSYGDLLVAAVDDSVPALMN